MDYCEALNSISKNPKKIYQVVISGKEYTLEYLADDVHGIVMKEGLEERSVSVLTHEMMRADWQELKLTGLQRLDRDYEKWTEAKG